MKTLKKLYVLTATLLISCNASDDPIIELNSESNQEFYSTNPYKGIGSFYQNMARTYHAGEPIKIKQLSEQFYYTLDTNNITISRANPVGSGFSAKNTTEDTSLYDLIENSQLSQLGKTSLHGFTDDLLNYNGEQINIVLQAIAIYESDIIDSTNLSSYDKQVILTFISLVEADVENQSTILLDEEDDQNDEDWDIIIGNMIDYLNIAFSQSAQQMANEMYKSLLGL